MADLTRVIPVPAPLTLGGRAYLASELRLRDVAELQAWINVRIPSPYESVAPILHSGERTRAWKRLLLEVVDRQESWPKEPGSPEAEALLHTDEGRKLLIALSLRHAHPELSKQDIEELYPSITWAEFSRLFRVAWGSNPMRAITSLIDGPSEEGGSSGPDWEGLYYRYITEVTNGPQFHDQTITQFVTFRCEGAIPDGRVSGPDLTLEEAQAIGARRRAFFAEIHEEESPLVPE